MATYRKEGAPTKYKPEYIKTTLDYVTREDVPFIEELALALGVDEDTIGNWGKKHPEFFGAIKRLKSKQRLGLQKQGLMNKINPTMAIFQLKCNHGFIESQHLDITSKGNQLSNVDLSTFKNLSEEELKKKLSEQLE